MMMSEYFTEYGDHTGSRAGKHYKATLFEGEHLMVGVNCLEPGQVQPAHAHDGADKVYVVMEGVGTFSVGEDWGEAGPGGVVFAPAGIVHGVENRGDERLTLLVGIAPPPK